MLCHVDLHGFPYISFCVTQQVIWRLCDVWMTQTHLRDSDDYLLHVYCKKKKYFVVLGISTIARNAIFELNVSKSRILCVLFMLTSTSRLL